MADFSFQKKIAVQSNVISHKKHVTQANPETTFPKLH
jgi:hypothetical protein